ncbi:hypothetical protein BpHYR1_021308 [Brachionus plicatilis]|uniref:Uncharacterized protein n=1 Tax=Brachionus plicatilis TaxID=10195 RepID=A0A3M7P853_BRAPC|nr:hypothetical protein BpHYR1_021308 [Brachionus plicatilis]
MINKFICNISSTQLPYLPIKKLFEFTPEFHKSSYRCSSCFLIASKFGKRPHSLANLSTITV